MIKRFLTRVAFGAAIAVCCLSASPASAALVSFVSGRGVDNGACASPASPCRTFSYAINQTSDGGEIKTLGPGFYGAPAINKSITIAGVDGAGIFRTAAGAAIIVNAGPTGQVLLRNHSLDGFGAGRRDARGIRRGHVGVE